MSLAALLRKVEQLVSPGMVEFYDRFPVSPMTMAYSAMDEAASDSSGNSLAAAAMVFEQRIERLAKLYREFQALTGEEPKISEYDRFLRESVHQDRIHVLCDQCKSGLKGRKWLKLFRSYRLNADGEQERFAAAICDQCSVMVRDVQKEQGVH